jgi:hypothetical protein
LARTSRSTEASACICAALRRDPTLVEVAMKSSFVDGRWSLAKLGREALCLTTNAE